MLAFDLPTLGNFHRRTLARIFVILALWATMVASAHAETPGGQNTEPDVDFNRHVLPVLADKCFHCHGPDAEVVQGDLQLHRRESVFADRGGYRIVAPGQPDHSELVRRVVATDADVRMPPPDAVRQLTGEEVALLRRWVEQGAHWTEHWAFMPPERPVVPPTAPSSGARGAIDALVLARLETLGQQPAAEADRETLVRRVTLHLTGLPPSPAEVDAFLADEAPDAYERLIDRLLASPRFGEHQAAAWLDAARYADTDGYQNDRLRYMWVWRDWLIRALNDNMPFDQFTIEQLAGDLLPDATLMQQIATGFCRNHRINSEGGSIPAEWAVEYVADRVETLGTTWLGLTIGCARCHDHKYDPISQAEFYELFAYFNNVPEWGLGPNNGNSPPFIEVPKTWPHITAAENRLIPPAPYRLKTTQTSVVRPNPGGENTVMVMQELAQPRPTYLLRRGQYDQPDKSAQLQPAVPAVLGKIPDDQPNNRLGLARWLVSRDNPLTARVVVNRHWQRLFGTGIVKTSENFGIQGEAPSHPRLLDWLATDFMDSGWDVKRLLRQIVTSSTYRQASSASRQAIAADPENRWLARGPRNRLPAQVIRDQALAASGLLVNTIGGEPVKPYMPPGIWKAISNNRYVQDHGEKLYRRSLYTYWRRTVPPPTMMTFNAAEREVCIVRKPTTNSPLQALTLMNNVTFVEAARMMAERIIHEGGDTDAARVAYGFRLLLARQPSTEELQVLLDALAEFRRRFDEQENDALGLLTVGEYPRTKAIPAAELAAMTMLASSILNLDEAVTAE